MTHNGAHSPCNMPSMMLQIVVRAAHPVESVSCVAVFFFATGSAARISLLLLSPACASAVASADFAARTFSRAFLSWLVSAHNRHTCYVVSRTYTARLQRVGRGGVRCRRNCGYAPTERFGEILYFYLLQHFASNCPLPRLAPRILFCCRTAGRACQPHRTGGQLEYNRSRAGERSARSCRLGAPLLP